MAMSLCYQYTHPTVALILKHVTQRPRSVRELSEKLGFTIAHVRDTCLWMHKRKIIRIEMWLITERAATRVFGPAGPGSAPDAVKPKSKRKRRRAADKRKKLPPLITTANYPDPDSGISM